MTSHGHYPINPPAGFPTGNAKWEVDPAQVTEWGPDGAFWSGVLGELGVQFRVELALGSADGQGGSTYDAPASVYDTATYSTDDISWVDLTSRVAAVTGGRGRGKLDEGFRAGQGQLDLYNDDGIFNPQRGINLVGDQAMRPGRWVRLLGKQTDADEWVPLWVMRVQSLADEYIDAAHQVISRWRLVGLETILEARQPPPLEVADPLTAGQTADERARYLWVDIMDIPDELLVTPDTYDHPMIATKFPGSRYDQMKQAVAAEGGDFYVGKEGLWYMRGRGWLDPDAPPKFQIGDYDLTDVVVLDTQTAWDLTRIKNAVFMTAEGGVTQGNVDTASQALYNVQSFTESGLQNDNDVDVVTLVDRQLALFAFDSLRIEQLEVWAPRLDGVDHLLNVELGDVVQVTVIVSVAEPWSYTIKGYVNEIRHQVTASAWKVFLRIDNTFRGNPLDGGPFDHGHDAGFSGGETP